MRWDKLKPGFAFMDNQPPLPPIPEVPQIPEPEVIESEAIESEALQAPTLRTYLGISLFWFAISFFWGAMLIIVMPARIEEIVGPQDKDKIWAVISSAGAFMSGVTQVVCGALSDNTTHRMGRRRPYLIAGVLCTTVVLLFFPGAKTFGAMLGVYLGIQLFLNVANGPFQALLPDLIHPSYHGRASAYMGVCLLLGRIGGAGVAGALMRQPDGIYRLTWFFIALLNTLMLANVFLLKERRHPHRIPLRSAVASIWSVPLRPYPSFVWLLISRFGIMLGMTTVTFCLLYYVGDTLGQGPDAAKGIVAQYMMIATVAGLVGTLPAGVASDRFSKKKVLFAANAICIASGIVFAMAPSIQIAGIAVTIFGLGFGTFAAVDWALACNLLPPGAPAKYLGVWSVSDVLAQSVAPLIAGPVAANINAGSPGAGYRFLMALAIGYFVLGTLAIGFIKENMVAAPVVDAAGDTAAKPEETTETNPDENTVVTPTGETS